MDWDEMARPWLAAAPDLEIALGPVLGALHEAAGLGPGEKVLDVGSGTGPSLLAAAQAVGPTGRVTGVDIAPPLLARAAERVPAHVDLITADAESHPFEPGAYDVVQANFGVMFFADSTAAFANLRRAVRPGGRFAATVWGGPADNPWFSLPRRIVDETVSDVPRPDPSGPGPMRFAEVAELERLLTATGWAPSVQTRDLALTPPGPPSQVAQLLMTVNVGMMLKGIEATTPQLEAIETALTEALAAFDQTDQIAIPARIHVVTAQAI